MTQVSEQGSAEGSSFFAIVSRMRYIERWALMRSTRPENLAEHSLDVAIIAHALATLANVRHGRSLDAEKAALIGLFHDTSEIITGDMPTPVKYANPLIRDAYKDVEDGACRQLIEELPEDLRGAYGGIYFGSDDEDEAYLRRLVKAADKISALIKCIEEQQAGNTEFRQALSATKQSIAQMHLPEADAFLDEFLGGFYLSLDEQQGI